MRPLDKTTALKKWDVLHTESKGELKQQWQKGILMYL